MAYNGDTFTFTIPIIIIMIIIRPIINIIIFIIRPIIIMSQVIQPARRLDTGWTARIESGCRRAGDFRLSFVSRLVLGSTQSPIK